MKNIVINENLICQINIAIISNSQEEYEDNDSFSNKNYNMELEDNILTFSKFSNICYPNNYSFFELNDQYKGNKEILLNKNIKNNNFSNLNKKNLKLSIIDIMREKYITKNKIKIPNSKYINFVKDVNNYASLLDFKYYKQKLNLEDIYIIYQQQYKKEQKKYFRFTISVNYYSSDLEQSIQITYPFLVKIPKVFKMENYDINNSFEKEEEEEEEEEEDKKIVENIVYSNYINNDNSSNTSSNEFNDNSDIESDYELENIIVSNNKNLFKL